MLRRAILMLAALLALPLVTSARPEAPAAKTIVLIGGDTPHGPFVHDAQGGVALLERYLRASPEIRSLGNVTIRAYPDGWPGDPAAFDGASTIVWYFDGLEHHPLLDAGRRARFKALMDRGVGLVAFHQASTLPPDDKAVPLASWLGAARYGMVDRTVETVAFTPADHPTARGVNPFAYRDEFYPTLRFDRAPVTPILRGALHRESAPADAATQRTVAWAFGRPGGGRSFGFTGFHYLSTLDHPDIRKLLLNAIVWTAGIDVPKDGVSSGVPRGDAGAIVTRAADTQVIEQSWGQLRWFTSAELGNSATMTTGQAIVRPGQQNPRHFHPNCDEILRVVQGRIIHTIGDRSVEMGPGDVVSIPEGVKHNARNIGTENAVLDISFSSAHRRTVGE